MFVAEFALIPNIRKEEITMFQQTSGLGVFYLTVAILILVVVMMVWADALRDSKKRK